MKALEVKNYQIVLVCIANSFFTFVITLFCLALDYDYSFVSEDYLSKRGCFVDFIMVSLQIIISFAVHFKIRIAIEILVIIYVLFKFYGF